MRVGMEWERRDRDTESHLMPGRHAHIHKRAHRERGMERVGEREREREREREVEGEGERGREEGENREKTEWKRNGRHRGTPHLLVGWQAGWPFIGLSPLGLDHL